MIPHLGKGVGPDVDVDVQCQQVCNDVCSQVPQKVCNDIQVPVQSCQKVPVQSTKQVCQRVCTQTYTQQINSGKGMPITSFGKGRRLMGVIGSLLTGKSMVAGKGGQLVDSNCNDVCNDVPITTYTTQCSTVNTTRTSCSIIYQQQCNPVCKPVCSKVTTVTTTTTLSSGSTGMTHMGKGGFMGKKH
eukprot:gene4218-4467_t